MNACVDGCRADMACPMAFVCTAKSARRAATAMTSAGSIRFCDGSMRAGPAAATTPDASPACAPKVNVSTARPTATARTRTNRFRDGGHRRFGCLGDADCGATGHCQDTKCVECKQDTDCPDYRWQTCVDDKCMPHVRLLRRAVLPASGRAGQAVAALHQLLQQRQHHRRRLWLARQGRCWAARESTRP